MERATGLEPVSPAWKAGIIAIIRCSLERSLFNYNTAHLNFQYISKHLNLTTKFQTFFKISFN